MALQLSITTPHGINLTTAYAKVSSFSGTKDNFTVHVEYFATQAARDAGSPIIMSQSFQWDTAEADLIVSDMYTWLKTLPEFANATDC